MVDARSGTPLPGSTVHLAWVTTAGASDSTIHDTATRTKDGAYIFCDVPQHTRLVAWAEALGLTSPRVAFFFEGGESAREDLSVQLRRVTGAVSGVLLDDSSGEPIAGATITIVGADVSGLTDSRGRFRLSDVPVGAHQAVVHHIAYGEPHLTFSVSSTMNTHLVVRLAPRAIALEPISIQVTSRRKWLETNGFYQRLDSSLGNFVTPEDIETQPYRNFAQVLRTVPAVNLRQVCTPHCSVLIRMAGSTQTDCIPTFYMDGRRINQLTDPDGTIDLDMLVFGADLAAVEVYRGISETPPQFYGRCGSIVIWTKRGAG